MSRRLLSFVLALLLLVVPAAEADNDIQGQPAPESADELVTSFDPGLQGRFTRETPFDKILEKSLLRLKLRNYYLNRSRPNNSDPRAWAQGGSLEYNVDRLGGVLGLTAEYFGSFKLYSPSEHDGTLLLEEGQHNIDTLGVLNPRATINGNIISAYRQKIDLPYVNSQDNRMVPNTFEGYVLGMPKTENEKFQYIVGYIAEMKTRNSESFESMSDVAGVTDKERGLLATGARYFLIPELSLAAVNYFVDDTLNISYAEAVHKAKFSEKLANTFSLQYSDQRSVGDDLIRGDDYTTSFWGIQNALSYNYLTAKAAFTHNDTGGILRTPYGSYPGYNSATVEDFNRAGEKAWQVGLAYNFARLGFKGAGITTSYINGLDAIDEITKENIPDREETDITLDYKLEEGALKGLWFRLRSAFIHEESRGSTEDYRIIVNYEIPLYEPPKASGTAS